jgi:hypothetical protein
MRKRGENSGSNRAYVLLNVSQGKLENVTNALRSMSGVASIDIVEGPPDVIMVLEAAGRLELARLTVKAMAAVEPMTENFHLIPARAN